MEQRQQANPARWVRLIESHPLAPDSGGADVLSPAAARRTRERTKALLGVAGTLLVATATAAVLWNVTGVGLRAVFGTQPTHSTLALGTRTSKPAQSGATAAPSSAAGSVAATATPQIILIAPATPVAVAGAAAVQHPLATVTASAEAVASATAMATPAPQTSPAGLAQALVTPSPVLSSQRTHVVERGDTLFSIARRNGTTVGALVAANGLGSQDAPLPVGQRLRIPVSDATPAARR
jgi:LysM repeat protein